MSTPIAVVTAIAGALVFGISAVADQRSTKRVKTRKALSPRIFVDLARQPLWLTAIGANVLAFVLQVLALDFGSLALVQPLLVCDLVFAVLISRILWDASGQSPDARRWDPVVLVGVVAATAGVAGFLAIGQPSNGHTQVRLAILPPLAIGLIVILGGCLLVATRRPNVRSLSLALACGVTYGAAAFVVKLLTSEFGGGLGALFTSWPIYVLAVVGPLGFLLNQDALQGGAFLAPVQSIITTADPVISIGLSLVWLNVTLRSSPGAIFGEVASLLLMTAGIVITSHHAPHVAGSAAADQASGKPAPEKALLNRTSEQYSERPTACQRSAGLYPLSRVSALTRFDATVLPRSGFAIASISTVTSKESVMSNDSRAAGHAGRRPSR